MCENEISIAWVRGNTAMLNISLYDINTDGTETPVNLDGYDDVTGNVYKLLGRGFRPCKQKKAQVEGVEQAISGNVLTLVIPSSLACGVYSVEVLLRHDDTDRRSYEVPIFGVVETNAEAHVTYEMIDGMRAADLDMKFQLVESSLVRGKNAYEMWRELPGNEGKTLQDFIDEVVNLNGITSQANTAIANMNTLSNTVSTQEATRVQAEGLREAAETTRSNAETARGTAESQRVQAENQRAQAEQGREQAEGTRQTTFETNERQRQTTFNTNEQARQSGETQRNTNESARQEAERLRAVAEVSRVNAEAQRNTSEGQRQTKEQARSDAEALRVQAENTRQQDTQTAIRNAEQATLEAENVNAQLSSDGGVVILTITNRQGNQTSKEVGFRIYKTYPSIAAMNADLANVEEGKFVMIAGSTEEVDTGKLFVRSASAFTFITDLSGAQGIKGDTGNGIASVTLNADYTLTIVFTDGTSTTTTSIRGEKGEKGDKGDKGDAFTYQDFTPAQIAELQRPATEAAQAAETATQGAENVNASLNGSVVTVTNRQGTSSSIDLLNAAYEVVRVVVTTDVSGVSVSGLVLNIYYNDATTPSDTATTDSNGVATFRVDKDYRYKITFPSIQGCKDIAPVSHVASVSERSVEVEYVEYNPITEGMQLTVFVADAQATGYTGVGVPDIDVNFTIEGVAETLTTGQDGKVQKIIPYGQSVQVEVPIREGKTLAGSKTRTFVASQASKYAEFVYTTTTAGLFIVTDDGQEYTEEEFENALEQKTVTAQDAKLLKVVTEELSSNNGIFYLSLDDLATRSNLPSKQWAASAVQFFDIPLNGNNASQPYYYDGRTASALIQDEGDRRNINTPAVDEALARTFTLSSGGTLKGFLGSVGQWAILWENRFLVDNILTTTRPSATYNFSTFHTNKWTSTQSSANGAWYWAAAAVGSYKGVSYYVVPFFAF